MYVKKVVLLSLFTLWSSLALWSQQQPTAAQVDPLAVRPADRVTQVVNNLQLIVLRNQHYPLATPENEIGMVPPAQRMEHMVLLLWPDQSQETALAQLIKDQQTPGSPHYHQWLTPKIFGQHFGISQNDLNQVVNWLKRSGFEVEQTPASHRTIVFSGTAGQVESAFHTSMRRYFAQGHNHYANATDPEIPRALAPVVRGVVSLHDFRSAPASVPAPDYTDGNGGNFLAPADWATIYNVLPVYGQYDGTGQSVAVVGRSDISLQDVEAFRTTSALPANDPTTILAGPDPGIGDFADQLEATLDVEWAGAIAKGAAVDFVTAESGSTDGVYLSAQYAVDNTVAPILAVSYGACEAALGSTGNDFFNGLWAEAASLGMSVFVASGDSGAAGCDSADSATASAGLGVNGICSSPYATCVGGTLFDDTADASEYWASTNGVGNLTALSYIPELAWNESASTGTLYASGGGVSTVYSKPSWQAGPGVPADGARDVPDVSTAGATHDAYVIQFQGAPFFVGGTSAATPSLASLVGLVLQETGTWQGNINPTLYTLATRQAYGGTAVFQDITSGNNSVPGQTGYSAGPGYDLVTGVGSVNASNLVTQWSSAATPAPLVSLQPSSLAFGNQTVGTTSSSQTVTLANPGNATLSITSIALTGANANQFAVTNTCGTMPASVKAGANCAISVTYAPTASGAASASVTVTDNAVGSPHSVSLTGTGTTPTVSLNPASIAFGNQLVGTTSAAQAVTLSNTGVGTLSITSITITGTNPAAFTELTTCGASLSPGASCTISVTFAPVTSGAKSASLNFNDNALDTPQSVALTGTGTVPAVSLSPGTIAFGNQTVGTASAATVVTLHNTGLATLTITNIAFTGANPGQFAQTNNCAATVSAGATCTISVTFVPITTGSKSASLTVTDSAAGSPHSVTMTGTGTSTPTVRLSPGSLDFGTSQEVGTTSSPRTIHLTNTGNATLTITSIGLAGVGANQYGQNNTCGTVPATLNAGVSCSISVTFAPTAAGAAAAATVSVADNASGSPQTVTLTGTATAPAVSLNPASIAFGNQPVGTTSSATAVTLNNTGNGPLSITSITFTGTNPGQFAQTNTCGATVYAGGSCTISVTFVPITTGSKSASLTVTDNASDSPESVALTGTGTPAAPVVSLNHTSLAFGNQVVNTTSAAQTVTLKNTGNASLSITSIALTGANANQFALVNPCGASLGAGNSCIISVTFSPTVAASASASLTFTDNAADSPEAVTITGTGTAAAAPVVSLSPTSIPFGLEVLGVTSTAQTVTLQNTGTATLTITSIGLAGTNASQFLISANTCGGTLNAAANCTISVTYTPSTLASAYALVTITDNAAGSPHSVSLSGMGTPQLTLNPPLIAFGPLQVGDTSVAQTVTLTNNFSSTINLTSTAITGANADQFAIASTTCAATLAAGNSCTVSVQFEPTNVASATAALTVTDTAFGSPHSVALTGMGTTTGSVVPVRTHRLIH